jgi:hypothetical protein
LAVLATAAFVSCSNDKNLEDTTPPVLKIYTFKVSITGTEQIVVTGNELHVGSVLVASWTDNVSKECKVKLEFNDNDITSGYEVTDS